MKIANVRRFSAYYFMGVLLLAALSGCGKFVLTPSSTGGDPEAGKASTGRHVALVLPLSGQYGNVATKIVTGAEIACREMSANGDNISLITIDTDQADWVSRVNKLPENTLVVGGPLRTNDFGIAKSQGLLSKRAFFTFLPTLDGGEEGRSAWRFFASPTDQANALLTFTNSLGIKKIASFHPDDVYGMRMARLFGERASAMGATVHPSTSYLAKDSRNWLLGVNSVLSANKSGAAPLQAIFLPDAWKSMETIIPNIFSSNETRLVLLGSSLWEQGLSRQNQLPIQNCKLAVFPGGWNAATPTQAGSRLRALMQSAGKGRADYWVGLGYDFARFSASLNVQNASSATINAALQKVSIAWSIAPIQWDGAGKAEEKLFLFNPGENGGMVPLDEAAFRKNWNAAWAAQPQATSPKAPGAQATQPQKVQP